MMLMEMVFQIGQRKDTIGMKIIYSMIMIKIIDITMIMIILEIGLMVDGEMVADMKMGGGMIDLEMMIE